jgi:hemoglobin/transferrin/lactoferrin receptor protein
VAAPAHAQITDSAVLQRHGAQIEEIIVVGARLPRPVQDVVGTVDVITHRDLTESLTVDLADTVRYTPGVSVAHADPRFGAAEFTIRGLSGNRVLSLVDGVRINDQFDIGAFANAGQDYLIPDAVARMEVLRGPASTLFGSDALGGVVAFITRDPEDFLRGANSAFAGSGTYGGADDSVTWTGSAAGRANALAGVIHGSYMEGNELDHKASAVSDQLDRTRRSAMSKLVYTLESGNTLRLRADVFDEDVDSDLRAVLGYGRRYRTTTSLEGDDSRQRYSLGLGYEFASDLSWLSNGAVNLYGQRSKVDQQTFELREIADPAVQIERGFEYEVDHYGLAVDLESRFEWGSTAHRIGWGIHAQRSELEEQRDGLLTDLTTNESTNVLLGEVMPVRDFPNSQVTEIGLYVHDEIAIGPVTIIPGLRFEDYDLDADWDPDYPIDEVVDISESEVVPKLGVLWRTTDAVTLYAQYARGFRAPTFYDVNIGLDLPRFNYQAIPNPDLKSETSDGVELGVRFAGRTVSASAAVFGADYDNFIETKVNIGVDPDTGATQFQSRNIEKARVYGVELAANADLSRVLQGLSLGGAFNWTKGENRVTDESLNTVDPAELVASLSWQHSDKLRLTATGTFVAEQDDVDETAGTQFKPDSFAVLDLIANYRLGERAKLNVGVFNLFDEEYWRWASVRNRAESDPLIGTLSAPGRYASVSLHVSL